MTILYVDDEEINLTIFERMFSGRFEVLVADSGVKGLEIISQNTNSIDIVMSDMKMPEMDGLEFIETARKTLKNACYLILSGFSLNERIEEAINKGVIKNYFSKPFNPDKFADQILEQCKR